MDEQSLEMLHEVSLLMRDMRKVCMSAAVIKTKYRYMMNDITVNKYKNSEKNPLTEKNFNILKKFFGELYIIEDTSSVSRSHIKNFCQQLNPAIDILD